MEFTPAVSLLWTQTMPCCGGCTPVLWCFLPLCAGFGWMHNDFIHLQEKLTELMIIVHLYYCMVHIGLWGQASLHTYLVNFCKTNTHSILCNTGTKVSLCCCKCVTFKCNGLQAEHEGFCLFLLSIFPPSKGEWVTSDKDRQYTQLLTHTCSSFFCTNGKRQTSVVV